MTESNTLSDSCDNIDGKSNYLSDVDKTPMYDRSDLDTLSSGL